MTRRVLITDYVHPSLKPSLEARGYTVDYNRTISLDEVKQVVDQYTGIVINSKIKMMSETMDSAPQLEWIARLGSGLEIIDLEHAAKKGIHVINTPEGNRNAVAEHAMGMLLMLANNLRQSDAQVRAMQWDRESNRGWELMGKTAGIVGLGNTGGKLAKKLSSWEVDIIAYDKYIGDTSLSFPYVERVELEELQKRADIISFHLPLTAETKHLVNDAFLTKCKDGVVLINTSRGKVIETQALIKGLESGKVKGACLDVFENEKTKTYTSEEKLMYQKLNAFSQVELSTHVAGWTDESLKRITNVLLVKLDSYYPI